MYLLCCSAAWRSSRLRAALTSLNSQSKNRKRYSKVRNASSGSVGLSMSVTPLLLTVVHPGCFCKPCNSVRKVLRFCTMILNQDIDLDLLERWLCGWSLSRGLPAPQRADGGLRVDVGWPEQRRRHVFADAGAALQACAA